MKTKQLFRNATKANLRLFSLFIAAILFTLNSPAEASQNRTVTTTWKYNEVAGLAGFKLYHQGEYLCQTDDPVAREISCPVTVTVETNEFQISAFDLYDNESSLSQIITVNFPLDNNNTAPIVENLTLTTPEDTYIQDTLIGSDPDNDSITFSIVDASVNGVVEITDMVNGAFRYTPNSNFAGNDSFTYIATDGTDDSNISTVSITVTTVNDSPVVTGDSVTTNEDTSITIAALLNDNDVDGDTLAITSIGTPGFGTAVINGDNIVYTPQNNFYGTDSFSYQVTDGSDVVTGNITIDVQAVNDAPVAQNKSIFTDEDSPVMGTMIANDIDSSNITYSITSNSSKGLVAIVDPVVGTFNYTPDANAFGEDTFTYQASDGGANSNVASVTITIYPINDPPIANAGPDQNITLGNIVTLDASNSFDIDNAITTIEWIQTSGEIIELSNPDAVQATFDTSGLSLESSSLTFLVRVTDEAGAQSQDTAIINVSWINESPVADAGDGMNVFEGELVTLDATQSSDPDDGISSYQWTQVFSGENHSIITLVNPTLPVVSFNAPDIATDGETLIFELVVTDSHGLQAQDSILINVALINEPPVANNNTAPIVENLTLTIPEDTDIQDTLIGSDPDNDSITFSIVNAGLDGVVEITDMVNGVFQYTPNNNFTGNDSFTYKATDGTDDSNISTVSITVTSVNDSPVVTGDNVTTNEDTSITIAALLNDNDVDGDTLAITSVGTPRFGTAVINGDNIIYTPQNNSYGTDSFSYQVSDGSDVVTGDITIDVQAVNDAPEAQNKSIFTDEESPVMGTMIANDIDSSNITYSIISNCSKGMVAIVDPVAGTFSYTPDANAFGEDTFTYQTSDGEANSNIASVTITIYPINDPPVANAGPDQNITLGNIVALDASNSFDIDNAITTIEWIQTSGEIIELSNSDAVQATFDTSGLSLESSSLTFLVIVTDEAGAQSQDTAIINVSWINKSPVADAGDGMNVFEGELVTLDATQSSDPDDGISSYQWTQVFSGENHSIITLADPTLPVVSFNAPDISTDGETLIFELVVTDYHGLQAQDIILVNVAWINEPPVANAGQDQNVNSDQVVYLDGSQSYDADDGLQTLQWTQIQGIPVTLSNPADYMTSFTAPQTDVTSTLDFTVTVTDVGGLQHADTISVTVAPSEQNTPVESWIEVTAGTVSETSKARWLKVYIELPEGFFVDQVNIDSIALSSVNGIATDPVIPTTGPVEIGDINSNGIVDLVVEFDKFDFQHLLNKRGNVLTVKGNLLDGTFFGQDVDY